MAEGGASGGGLQHPLTAAMRALLTLPCALQLEQAESERLRCAALQDSLKAALTSSKQVPVLGKPRSKQFLAAALEHCQVRLGGPDLELPF